MRTAKLWVGFWLALCGVAFAQPPNVLLITADDLGWDSLGCTGNSLEGLSPNLDRLASEGLLIEHAHIATPICGPSREALYTGQYPQRNGYMGHGQQPPQWWTAEGRQRPKTSITSALTDAGYLTGVVGKHGSTRCRFSVPPYTKNEQTGMGRNPAKYFEFVRSFLARAKEEGKPFYLAANAHDPHRYWARHPSETTPWINQSMGEADWNALENGKPYPDPKMEFDPADCLVPAAYPDDARLKKDLTYYYGSVNRMDEVVGELLRALEESGLAENTLVIFLSDHGMAWDMSKWSLYPSGTKTPVIVRWPGRVAVGQTNTSSLLSVVDIAPTLAEVCGLSAMKDVDGQSFNCVLEGRPDEWTRSEAFTCFNYMNNERELDQQVSVYTNTLSATVDQYRPSRALSSTQFTYVWNGWSDGEASLPRNMLGEFSTFLGEHSGKGDDAYPDYAERARFVKNRVPEELYNTVKDPGCLNNLAQNPEYRSVIEGFHARMEKVLSATNDQELGNYSANVLKK